MSSSIDVSCLSIKSSFKLCSNDVTSAFLSFCSCSGSIDGSSGCVSVGVSKVTSSLSAGLSSIPG